MLGSVFISTGLSGVGVPSCSHLPSFSKCNKSYPSPLLLSPMSTITSFPCASFSISLSFMYGFEASKYNVSFVSSPFSYFMIPLSYTTFDISNPVPSSYFSTYCNGNSCSSKLSKYTKSKLPYLFIIAIAPACSAKYAIYCLPDFELSYVPTCS